MDTKPMEIFIRTDQHILETEGAWSIQPVIENHKLPAKSSKSVENTKEKNIKDEIFTQGTTRTQTIDDEVYKGHVEKTPSEIFKIIQDEDEQTKQLPSKKGFLRKYP